MNDANVVKMVLQQANKQNAIEQLERVNLTLKEKRVAELIYFDGLTIEEVAEIMDVSTSSITKWKKSIISKCSKVFGMCV